MASEARLTSTETISCASMASVSFCSQAPTVSQMRSTLLRYLTGAELLKSVRAQHWSGVRLLRATALTHPWFHIQPQSLEEVAQRQVREVKRPLMRHPQMTLNSGCRLNPVSCWNTRASIWLAARGNARGGVCWYGIFLRKGTTGRRTRGARSVTATTC